MKKDKYLSWTLVDLRHRFDEYNRLYFGNKLPPCNFGFCLAQGTWGMYIPLKGKIPKLLMNRAVYWDENSFKLIFIHEMVHHYVATIFKPAFIWDSPHGLFFNLACLKLQYKYGLKVAKYNMPRPRFHTEIPPKTYWEKVYRHWIGSTFRK